MEESNSTPHYPVKGILKQPVSILVPGAMLVSAAIFLALYRKDYFMASIWALSIVIFSTFMLVTTVVTETAIKLTLPFGIVFKTRNRKDITNWMEINRYGKKYLVYKYNNQYYTLPADRHRNYNEIKAAITYGIPETKEEDYNNTTRKPWLAFIAIQIILLSQVIIGIANNIPPYLIVLLILAMITGYLFYKR